MGTVTAEPARTEQAGADVVAVSRRKARRRAVLVVLVLLAAFSAWALFDGGVQLYLQRFFDGLANGFLYGLAALSLVIVFKATRIINFAQGPMAMLGCYLALTLLETWGVPVLVAVVIAMAVSGLGAAALERALIRPFDQDNHMAIIIVTLALFLGFNALAALVWGFHPKSFPSPFPQGTEATIEIAGARLPYQAIGIAVLVVATVVVLELVLNRTRLGLAFRCVANDVERSRLLGIDIGRTVQFSWALAAAVGTLGACLIAPSTYVDPGFMNKILVYAFAAATLGGLDSIRGALAGGLLTGLSVSLVTGYLPGVGSELGLVVAFAVIIAVLQFKPAGLFGNRAMERV
ncbi:branched-chain amino acid ABC transporter permease [Nonomuraea sp. LP-02]|uniref:branched-chain amino acid ABC transporter permease n=1 Tax=Nonomuraea sp. LP-02 TaxID=3097960 RepID=UPI002E31A17E|nr:branched-chain amino acid ABC transporter permease [Nonomuraea sp. LP-02]MED7931600.1 branched-chain amino acid ABC transporter permease [Nonomuraea sp. LP-02]